MNRLRFASLALGLLSSAPLSAQPVIETYDRFEMNWSTMRIRFFGESSVGKNLDVAEKEATDQGLLYALANVPKIRGEKGLSVDNAGEIANAVSKQSYAYNTVYFSNGKVRVELESSLALALDPGRKPFVPSEQGQEDVKASGGGPAIVIQLSGSNLPGLIREVQDSSGELAYSSQNVSPEAYRKALTGRWFYANSSELKSFVGANPVEVSGTFQNGKVVVDKASWDEVRQKAQDSLTSGKVAFVLPRAN